MCSVHYVLRGGHTRSHLKLSQNDDVLSRVKTAPVYTSPCTAVRQEAWAPPFSHKCSRPRQQASASTRAHLAAYWAGHLYTTVNDSCRNPETHKKFSCLKINVFNYYTMEAKLNISCSILLRIHVLCYLRGR